MPELNASERFIYLDFNATTPVLASVVAAMNPYWSASYGNPSSSHLQGRQSHDAIEGARAEVAQLVGVAPQWVVFTGGATEANNLALRGAANGIDPARRHLIISAVEHPAVAEPAKALARDGWKISVAPVDSTGRLKLAQFEALLSEDVGMVSIMHANNETGTLQPIKEVSALTKPRGIVLHTDAAQSVGKVPVSLDDLGVNMLVIAGHKFYAPKGVGALVRDPALAFTPIVFGAGHEGGLRPGTENVPLIVGLGEAARLARLSLDGRASHLRAMRDRLYKHLLTDMPGLLLNCNPAHMLPNTLNVSLPACAARPVLASLAELLGASAGSACHSGDEAVSGVLGAMGFDAERAAGAIRFSAGLETTQEDVDRAASLIVDAWMRYRRS